MRPVTPLRDHVSHVVRIRSKEQVTWIDAPTVIAAMEYVQSVGNVTIRLDPCRSMSTEQLASDANLSVSTPVKTPHPQPTRFGATGTVDARPEFCSDTHQSLPTMVMVQSVGAEMATVPPVLVGAPTMYGTGGP